MLKCVRTRGEVCLTVPGKASRAANFGRSGPQRRRECLEKRTGLNCETSGAARHLQPLLPL